MKICLKYFNCTRKFVNIQLLKNLAPLKIVWLDSTPGKPSLACISTLLQTKKISQLKFKNLALAQLGVLWILRSWVRCKGGIGHQQMDARKFKTKESESYMDKYGGVYENKVGFLAECVCRV